MSKERIIGMPGVIGTLDQTLLGEKSAQLEQIMHQAVLDHIVIPDRQEDLPRIIVIAGPCRTATGALATALNRLDEVTAAHIQPHKTVRRRQYSLALTGQDITYARDTLVISPGDHIEVVKETVGPRTQAELFNPLRPLLDRGYPPERIILMPTVREPLETYDSTVGMWDFDYITPEGFNGGFELTLEAIHTAILNDISVLPYVHELIRDHVPEEVIGKTLQAMGLSNDPSSVARVIDWGNDGYERTVTYEIPPKKFINGSVGQANGGRGGLVWKPHRMVMSQDQIAQVQPQIERSYEIYQGVRSAAKRLLGLK